MSITTLGDLDTAALGAQIINMREGFSPSFGVAHFGFAYGVGAGFAAPGTSGQVYTRATVGALPLRNSASGHHHIIGASLMGASSGAARLGTLFLADKLWGCGGFSGVSTALNSITTSIGRGDTTGWGIQVYAEIFAALGTTAANITVTYTNQDGVTGRTGTIRFPGTTAPAVNTIYPMELQSGDTGVRAVASFQLSGTTGTAGSYGIIMVRELMMVNVTGIQPNPVRGFIQTAAPRVDNDACLFFYSMFDSTSNTPKPLGSLVLVEG
jgi:hypothetical protein